MRMFFFILTCVLFVLAIVSESVAKHHCSKAASTIARSTTQPQAAREQARIEAKGSNRSGDFLRILGHCLAMAGGACWFISWKRKEKVPHSITIIIFAAYVMWWLVFI